MLNEYPRPQLRRDSYMCLNGTWNYVISEDDNYNGEYIDLIEVPYPIESKLSKVGKRLNKNEYLYYKREFEITKSLKKDITLLHFGAFANFDSTSKHYMFGSKSGNFTFFRNGKNFRLESSIQHGLHYHSIKAASTAPQWKLIFKISNSLSGFIGGLIGYATS